MSSRLNDAMNNLNMGGSRNSIGRAPGTPGAQRHSTIEQSDIDTMFPEAVAAIADQRAKFSASTGQSLDRNSLAAPTISAIVSIGILELQNNDLHYELLLL